jgi:hypothetical protein
MTKYWFDYVKSCYDLVLEAEGRANIILDHEVEAYVVHLMANNFERTDIGTKAIAIELMSAMQQHDQEHYRLVGDECLIIHSYPLKRNRWPSSTYYQDMGQIAYGFAGHLMEKHFVPAGQVLRTMFSSLVE